MKRILLTVLAVVAFAGTASAQGWVPYLKLTPLAKRVQNVTNTDSSTWTLKIASTTAAGDTTAAIDIADLIPAVVAPGAAATTAFYGAKLIVTMSNDASGPDSIYYKYRVTYDGTTWGSFTTLTGFVPGAGATNPNMFSVPLTLDTDAKVQDLWMAKGVQFVILSDYSAARPHCSAYFVYYAAR